MGGLPLGGSGRVGGCLSGGFGFGAAQGMQGNMVPGIHGGRGVGGKGMPFMWPMMFQPAGFVRPPRMPDGGNLGFS